MKLKHDADMAKSLAKRTSEAGKNISTIAVRTGNKRIQVNKEKSIIIFFRFFN